MVNWALTISRLDGTTTDLARESGAKVSKTKALSVYLIFVITGGVLGAAQDVSGLWLRDKVVVSERRGEKVTDELVLEITAS